MPNDKELFEEDEHVLKSSGDESKELKDIDVRIEELKNEGKSKKEIVQILYEEGYSTKEIMRKGFPLRYLKRPEIPESKKVEEDEYIKIVITIPMR